MIIWSTDRYIAFSKDDSADSGFILEGGIDRITGRMHSQVTKAADWKRGLANPAQKWGLIDHSYSGTCAPAQKLF